MKKSIISLSLASVISSPASFADTLTTANTAEQKAPADEIILVTANRTPQSSNELLGSYAVFTRDDIDQLPVRSVAELLSTINGIQMSATGGAGQTTSLFTRGTNAGHTLVVIDGQRVSSATLGQVPFADLSLDQIERVEIIKGPRASLWGSDAIGGVIQLFTRQLAPGELAVDLGYGNHNQMQASVSAAIGHGDGATTFTAAARASDGYDVFESAEPDDDGYNKENVSIKGYQKLTEQWQVDWLAKYDQGNNDYDNSWGNNEASFETTQFQLSATQEDKNWHQAFHLGSQTNETISFGKEVSEKDGSIFETSRLQANWLAGYQFSQQLSLNWGADYIKESVDTSTDYTEDARDIYAVYTHINYDNQSQIVEASVRYDDIEGVDSEVSYSASFGQRFSKDTLVSLNIGTGFKAPSFNDLYYPADAFSYGNPDLLPETSQSIELLINTHVLGVDAQLSLYNTDIEDLIVWDPDQDFRYTPNNVAQAEISGIELTLSADLLSFSHEVQLGYLDAEDSTSKTPLIRRAEQTARYQLSRQWNALNVLASVSYRGEYEDSQWPSTITMPSVTLIDLSASYQLNNDWTLGLKVNNLLDEEYFSANHYYGQPAQYLVTVSYRQ